jgi:hypothetical protein
MSSYRLLRSNKESGPYSQEQIIALGFKPYDLIWVEGKSAGWRYPGEIPELVAYAPMVEEQPYDRFFKKPVVPARGTPLPETLLAAGSQPVAHETLNSEPQRPAYTPASLQLVGKHIHVTLPSGNTLNVTTVSNRREQVADNPVQHTTEEKKPSFSESISQVSLTPVMETVAPVKTARAIGADENEASSYYPVQSPASSYSWTTLVGLITGIATLVGLGIMIGLSINRTKPGEARTDAPAGQETQQVAAAPVVTEPANSPATGSLGTDKSLVATNTPVESQPPVSAHTEPQPVVRKDAGNGHQKSASTTKKDISQLPAKPIDKPGSGTDPIAKEPVIVHPGPAEAVPAVNLEKQVNIVTNGYKVGAFGGISGLQCTLVNDSRYALETVEVELQYIQANDKVYKTETLSFRDVAAGAQMTINAPKSSRGIKIISRIVKINSKEPGLAGITVKS